MEILKPFRKRIDQLDEQIIELLSRRYEIIREVAEIKARENIPSVLQDRVDEVRENAVRLAAAHNLDEDFIRKLYAQLIQHSCDLEECIIQETHKKKATR